MTNVSSWGLTGGPHSYHSGFLPHVTQQLSPTHARHTWTLPTCCRSGCDQIEQSPCGGSALSSAAHSPAVSLSVLLICLKLFLSLWLKLNWSFSVYVKTKTICLPTVICQMCVGAFKVRPLKKQLCQTVSAFEATVGSSIVAVWTAILSPLYKAVLGCRKEANSLKAEQSF